MRERLRFDCLMLAIIILMPEYALAQGAGVAPSEAQVLRAPAAVQDTSVAPYATGRGWRVDFLADPATTNTVPPLALASVLPSLAQDAPAQGPRPVAFEYSDAYHTRRKIHVYASIAMIPLFVTQFALGDSLYENSTDSKRTAHAVVGSSIGVLFGLNTVTGVWNLWEGRKDPVRRTRRITHGLMMLAADAGFVTTAMLAPGDDGSGNRSAHRAVAITSMSIATASYVFMLLTR